MAFGKPQQQAQEVRTSYDPYDEKDKEIILNFESVIAPYGYNFEAYAKDIGLTVHYGRYALLGAVNGVMAQVYREMRMRYNGLQYLRWIREKAKDKSNEQIESLVNDKAEMERGMKL